jgi:XTP/dITP diphosphohydrolase
MDGLPVGLPALAFASKVLGKAGAFDAIDAVRATDDETAVGAELLALVARARASGIDAEQALRRSAALVVAAYQAAERATEPAAPDDPRDLTKRAR